VATNVLRNQQYKLGVRNCYVGRNLHHYTKVQSVIHQWLRQQPALSFAPGNQKLVDK